MDTIEDTASDWLDHLRVERGASAHTVSNYRRDIRRYARDLGARGITDIAGVRAADIEAHLASLASGGLTGAQHREATKALARLERRVGKAGDAVGRLQARLEEAAADPARVGELARLGRDLSAAQAEQAALEEQWLQAAQALED